MKYLLFSILSLRGVKRRSNPVSISKALFSGLLRCARNDGIFFVGLIFFSPFVFAHDEQMPFLTKVMIDRLEFSDQQTQSWEAQAWVGHDLQKVWLKTEGERNAQQLTDAEFQLLYGQAISPFWDVQWGWRRDVQPESRDWITVAAQGLAPYWVDSYLAVFFGENNRIGVRLKGEYEFSLTQQWIVIPELEVNAYGQNDDLAGTGAGLSDTRFGVRLHYGITRELMPYVGINWEKKWGSSADFARAAGDVAQSHQAVIGVRMWF